jgi:hypothetical protein
MGFENNFLFVKDYLHNRFCCTCVAITTDGNLKKRGILKGKEDRKRKGKREIVFVFVSE